MSCYHEELRLYLAFSISCVTPAKLRTHTLSPCLMTRCLYRCHLHLLSASRLLSHGGKRCLDLQLSGALRPAFVYCTAPGPCSGMRCRRRLSDRPRNFSLSASTFHPPVLRDACVNTRQAKLAPFGTSACFFSQGRIPERHACFNRNRFNSVKSYKMNIVQK